MKALWRILGAVVAVGLTACEPLDDGGGGGGGGSVLFTRGFAFVRSDRNVYVVDDSGDANNPQRLTTAGGARHPTVSGDGRSIVFVHQVGTTSELLTVPTSGAAQPSTVFSSTDPSCSGCGKFHHPTFSPDGRVIVFAVERGSILSLARVGADGSGFQLLTDGTVSYGAPSFFPDGQSVLAPAGTLSSQLSQLARVGLSGGAPVYLSNNLGSEAQVVVTRAAVSPDGTRVAFDGRLSSGASRLFVATLGQQSLGVPTRVTDYPGSGVLDSFPSWRGNTELGFLSNAGGTDSIYRINASSVRGSGNLTVPSASEPAYGGR